MYSGLDRKLLDLARLDSEVGIGLNLKDSVEILA